MSFINSIKERAKLKDRRIILPESMDERVVSAACMLRDENICHVILIGNIDKIHADFPNYDLTNIDVIDPLTYPMTEDIIKQLYELRKEKGMTEEEARKLIFEDYMYFSCMLVKNGNADGVVSGACHSSANTLRPALQIIKTKKDSLLVSAFFLMIVPDCEYGENGTFLFADCGLEQNPDSEKLAAIAKDTAKSFELLVEKEARVAMISHSTKGSAKHADVDKVVEATRIAKEKYQFLVDGELQVDAAIVPEIGKMKAPDSDIAGTANVLVFPDLDAGNAGYKLVQRLAKAEAYGPITQGIAAPVNDLSRGCSAEDIVGAVAITCLQV